MDAMMTPTDETTPPAPAAGNPVYISIPLTNDPTMMAILAQAMDYMGPDSALVWQSPGTMHVSLCYAPDVSDKALKKIVAALEARPVELLSAGINVFNTPNGFALHLALKRTDSLMDLQIHAHNACVMAGAEVSEHHTPEAFHPHITLGYFRENPVQRYVGDVWFARQTAALEVTRANYKRVAMLGEDTPGWRFIERFSLIKPDEWFRILPVGEFVRFGRTVKVTFETVKEMAANFGRVPSNRLPVNREHEGVYGKVGDIAAVEPRSDGLYAKLSWLPSGLEALAEQAYQYFSPEIYWGPTEYDGQIVSNVLVGLALTNSPYFGQLTALYSLQDSVNGGGPTGTPDIKSFEGGSTLSDSMTNKQLIKEALEEFRAQQAKPADPPADPTESEQFKALKAENEQIKRDAEAYRQQASEAARLARVEKYTTELGADHKAVAEKFAALSDEQKADELVQEFKALKAQANPELFSEKGASTPTDSLVDDAEKFAAMIDEQVKGGMEYMEAMNAVAKAHPTLFEAHRAKTARGG